MDDFRNDGNKDLGLERRLARLITEAENLGAGREHRREALIERAESRGIARGEAEMAYDLALEEGLEPAYALAVVGQGISVRALGETSGVETTDTEPGWIDRPPSAEEARRERRLRDTFRRLRSFLDKGPTPRDAITRFAREPDLEPYDY